MPQRETHGAGSGLASTVIAKSAGPCRVSRARAKVTGSAEYIHNLRLPGMLHGKIHRSPVAHGRIVGIDASAALALEGVHAVDHRSTTF